MIQAGADFTDEPVVIDGSLITSRRPSDMDAFTGALGEALTDRPSVEERDRVVLRARARVSPSDLRQLHVAPPGPVTGRRPSVIEGAALYPVEAGQPFSC